MPLEGGLYQWASRRLRRISRVPHRLESLGVAVLILATFGVMIATNLAYLSARERVGCACRVVYTGRQCGAIVSMTIVSLFGLRAASGCQGIGGAAQMLTYVALHARAVRRVQRRGMIHEYHALRGRDGRRSSRSSSTSREDGAGRVQRIRVRRPPRRRNQESGATIGRRRHRVPIIALMFILGTDSVVASCPETGSISSARFRRRSSMGFQGLGFAR